jgi:hypothetical protein
LARDARVPAASVSANDLEWRRLDRRQQDCEGGGLELYVIGGTGGGDVINDPTALRQLPPNSSLTKLMIGSSGANGSMRTRSEHFEPQSATVAASIAHRARS